MGTRFHRFRKILSTGSTQILPKRLGLKRYLRKIRAHKNKPQTKVISSILTRQGVTFQKSGLFFNGGSKGELDFIKSYRHMLFLNTMQLTHVSRNHTFGHESGRRGSPRAHNRSQRSVTPPGSFLNTSRPSVGPFSVPKSIKNLYRVGGMGEA